MSTVMTAPARSSLPRRNPAPPGKLTAARPWLVWGSCLNLAAVLALWMLLSGWADDFWAGTAMLYLPRSPYLLPSLILIPLALRWNRKAVWPNLAAAILVVGPIMGLRLNLPGETTSPETDLTVVSCNVQFYKPNFASVAREMFSFHPDVVAFQDADGDHPLVEAHFAGWNMYRDGEFLIASRYPVKHIATCTTEVYQRATAIMCEIEAPSGPIRVVSLHHMSPREGLSAIRPTDIMAETGDRAVEQQMIFRAEEAAAVRDFVELHRENLPLVVMGDFNLPVESHLYQSSWGDLTNAFDAAGIGYGYTILCTTRAIWPEGFPWCRVDHIVASPDWQVRRCWTGSSNGSDHRCIAAILSRTAP